MNSILRHSEFSKNFICNQLSNGEDLVQTSYLIINENTVAFNYSSEKGNAFVIVRNELNEMVLLGYSTDSNIDVTKPVPPVIKKICETKINKKQRFKKEYNKSISEDYLIKTEWHQLSPFSDQTPGVAGCVAVSMAQVMKYYNYPPQGINDIPPYEDMPGIPVSEMKYDWGEMLNVYDANSPEESKQEVSRLILHVGCGVQMKYSGVESSASGYDITPAFLNYFGFDKTTDFIENSRENDILTADVLSRIFDYELKNLRPVIVNGAVADEPNHSIICDGKDDNGMYHFNIGYGDGWNGYYLLETYLSFVTTIDVGLQPAEDDYLVLQTSMPERVVIDNNQATLTITVASGHIDGFDGELGILILGEHGEYIYDFAVTEELTVPPSTNKSLSIELSVPEYVKNGSFRANLVARDKRFNRSWRSPLLPDSVSNECSLIVERSRVSAVLEIISSTNITEILSNQKILLDFTLHSHDDIVTDLELSLWDELGNYVQPVSTDHSLSVSDNETVRISLELDGSLFPKGGHYQVRLSHQLNDGYLLVPQTGDDEFYIELDVIMSLPQRIESVIVETNNFPDVYFPYYNGEEFSAVIDNKYGRVFGLSGYYISLLDEYNNIIRCGEPSGKVVILTDTNTYNFKFDIDFNNVEFKDYRFAIIAVDSSVTYILSSTSTSTSTSEFIKPVELRDYSTNSIRTVKNIECPADITVGKPFTLSTTITNTGEQHLDVNLEPINAIFPDDNDFTGNANIKLAPHEIIDVSMQVIVHDKKSDGGLLNLSCSLSENKHDISTIKTIDGKNSLSNMFSIHLTE